MVTEPEVAGVGQLVNRAVPREREHNLDMGLRHPRRVVQHDYAVDVEQRERLHPVVQSCDYTGCDHIGMSSS